jgi:hypothetical protein
MTTTYDRPDTGARERPQAIRIGAKNRIEQRTRIPEKEF